MLPRTTWCASGRREANCHLPATRRWVSPGSLAATALWLAGSALFSWFASTYAKADRVDGSLGVIITILTWFLLSAYIVILGAELDAEIARELAARDDNGARHDQR